MRDFIFLWCQVIFLSMPVWTLAQSDVSESVTRDFVEAQIRFLASDLLEGRKTGSRGNQLAAKYLEESFRSLGLQSAEGLTGYRQQIDFSQISPADSLKLTIEAEDLDANNVIVMQGEDIDFQGKMVYAQQAWGDDIKDLELGGKYVLAYLGSPGRRGAQEGFQRSKEKIKALMEKGAEGLIEVYNGRVPWTYVKRFMDSPRMQVGSAVEGSFPHMVINHDMSQVIKKKSGGSTVNLICQTDGVSRQTIFSSNVVAMVEGSDPELKDEYLVLTAHYDHIGLSRSPENKSDTVFNGARDNAIGCATMLGAAKYLAMYPPKRSVLCVAFTGEEMGLLGSQYFVDHPVVPLRKMVFALNTDGAGYNDTTIVSLIGCDRVSLASELKESVRKAGLAPFSDPAPEQNLFDRSDNASFAAKGIPAPSFSPGFKAFDDEIMKNYHQLSDEADDLDYNYLHKFCLAYIHAAVAIANSPDKPRWMADDKYEPAFNQLYGN